MKVQEADVPAMVTALIGRRVRTDLPATELECSAPEPATLECSTPGWPEASAWTGKHRMILLPRQIVPAHDDFEPLPSYFPLVDIGHPQSPQRPEHSQRSLRRARSRNGHAGAAPAGRAAPCGWSWPPWCCSPVGRQRWLQPRRRNRD